MASSTELQGVRQLQGTAGPSAVHHGDVSIDLVLVDLTLPGDTVASGTATVEYTTELEAVDEDTWHPHLYDFSQPGVSDQWGTANTMNEFVAAKSFNDPDKGLFIAPPV